MVVVELSDITKTHGCLIPYLMSSLTKRTVVIDDEMNSRSLRLIFLTS